jgi:plastocyanin
MRLQRTGRLAQQVQCAPKELRPGSVRAALGGCAVAVSAVFAGCASRSVEPPSVYPTVLVGPSGDHRFLPPALTVPTGTTVRWFWDSDGHTVTSGAGGMADGQFCSPSDTNCAAALTSNAGTVYLHTFTKPGTYPYSCIPHYAVGMKGTIVVQ